MVTLLAAAFLLNQIPQIDSDLKFDDCFPRKSFWGKTASGLTWSSDGRYLAYFWNPYEVKGGLDLYLYDTSKPVAAGSVPASANPRRMTSMEFMKPYDRDIAKAIERYKKDVEDEDKADKMGDMEWREWVQNQKEEAAKRKEPLPSYPGISEVEWAHKSNEFLMVFKGDIYRWRLGAERPVRLTRTRDSESNVEFTPNDDGFTFRRGDGVYRVNFDSAVTEQLNPALPTGLTFAGYRISPDGTKMMVQAGKTLGSERQVDWISYKGRFAQAQKTSRNVADDKFAEESYLFLYDISDDAMENAKGDGKPWEVWKWPGGEDWWEVSISENPFSKDSTKFVFAGWKRDANDLQIVVADLKEKKTSIAYKDKDDGDHDSPGLCNPFFAPSGEEVVCLLDKSGYRQAWKISLLTNLATQVTKGDFDLYPVQLTPDGKQLICYAGAEDPARMQVYRADMATGALTKWTTQTGNYGRPKVSKDGTKAALTFANWSSPNETYVIGTERQRDKRTSETKLTSSHRYDAWNAVNKVKPELFTFKNRNGQTVHGYVMLPPGFDKSKPRPLFMYVYGGPLGTGYSVMDGAFNSTAYIFAMYLTYTLGYVTCTIDPRGQSGYGNAFGMANFDKPGVPQTEDLTDCVKHLQMTYNIDTKKVGINGWSFGGFQTQMCMYTAPDVFTLGIAGAGPTEWQNYNTWYTGAVITNTRDGKSEDTDKFSLTKLAKNLKGPLLLLHGIEDTNVLFQDTVHVYQKLLQYGKGPLVELALDPTGGHGMGGDMSNHDRHQIYLQFILKWWGKG
ncbi:MAG: S9 family peptidase [Armatimonadetes bacterium]|nr:S9 family peptidase [Armatimonadota bacterium]